MILNVKCRVFSHSTRRLTSYIPWNSLSNNEILFYESTMAHGLDAIAIPNSVLHGSYACSCTDHCLDLERYYHDIISAIADANNVLPRKKHGTARSFWTPELSNLKQKSLDSCHLWKLAGCPRSGPVFLEKHRAHLEYKAALRLAKKSFSEEKNDDLLDAISTRDGNLFWKRFNSLHGTDVNVNRIDGHVDKKDISNSFKETFGKVYTSNDSSDNSQLTQRFFDSHAEYSLLHGTDDLGPYYFSWADMLTAFGKIKIGKASGGFVRGQHIFLGSPKLAVHLNILFNGLLQHSYIPHDFLVGTVTPVVKDKEGDINSSTNYRPITLSHIFSQLLEHLILIKTESFLQTNELQFGFKRNRSTSHALFVLKSCVDYYIQHGSNCFVTFLDCTKAFDKISHHGLFLKLIQRGFPLCFINLLVYWYSNMHSRCKWDEVLSDYFLVTSGVKQGGVLSPRLFTVYIDDLVVRLKRAGIGCHMARLFIGAILFADDLCLLAPTRSALQKMLNICRDFFSELCLTFNPKKSKSLLFGKGIDSVSQPLFLGDEPIEYVKEWKYLGATVVSGSSISFCPRNDLRKFYASFNSIFNSFTRPSEVVMMRLLYSNCVPNLTYAADVKELSSTEMTRCNTAINDAIRKIFSFQRWESIRSLRSGLGYQDVYSIFEKRRNGFYSRLPKSGVLGLLRSLYLQRIQS